LNRQGIGRGGRLRAAFATLLALSLLASLGLAQTASARTLSERLAVKQAARLMNKQLRDRDRRLVEARVSIGERVNRNRFVFLYDDLNRQGVVCTGTIDVRLVPPGGNKVVARFLRDTNCERPGDEALGYRAAARFAGAAFAKRERSVLRSVTRYIEQAQACEDLQVPDDRQDEALLMLSTGLTQATIRPLSGTLDNYAATLQSLGATDEQLARGAAAWRDFVNGVRSLPKFGTSYCTVLAEWGANGYTDATAPVDFAALRTLAVRLQADGAEVRRTARALAKRGIDPVTVRAFTLDDLIGNTGLGNPNEDAVARTLKHYRKLAR
jgi:hypothetical protein